MLIWACSAAKRCWSRPQQPAVRRPTGGTADDAPGADRCRAVEQLLRSTDNWILTGSAVFRRECVIWAGGFDARLGSFADGFLARKIALRYGFLFEPKVVASWVVFPDSVSRKTALDPQRAQHILDVVPALIAADPGFPPWYADAFRDRWRFATCRLALAAEPIDRELLRTMAAGTAEQARSWTKFWRCPVESSLAWSSWPIYGIGFGRLRSPLCCGPCWRCEPRARLWAFASGNFAVRGRAQCRATADPVPVWGIIAKQCS